ARQTREQCRRKEPECHSRPEDCLKTFVIRLHDSYEFSTATPSLHLRCGHCNSRKHNFSRRMNRSVRRGDFSMIRVRFGVAGATRRERGATRRERGATRAQLLSCIRLIRGAPCAGSLISPASGPFIPISFPPLPWY